MSGKILIIAGGELDLPFAEEYLASHIFDRVVCADAGLEGAGKLHLSVDCVMGDYDSVSEEVLEAYRSQNHRVGKTIEFVQYPPEKDATDLELALDWAVEQHPEEIVILGATGGRLDHFIANVNILMKPLSKGIPASIVDRYNRLSLLDAAHASKRVSHGEDGHILHVFHRKDMHGKYISFLPLTERVRNVTLRGFRYELDGQDMVLGSSLGVSNELAEERESATVDFSEGILIAVESGDLCDT